MVCLQFFPNTIGVTLEMMSLRLFLGSILSSPNHTYITLVTKFHPIAICNVLYKVISKVLANQLKRRLPKISSESQSAFQENKSILDNILVAFEILHHMKTKSLVNRVF